MKQSPLEWQRGPRSAFTLTQDAGVYALFLRDGSTLRGVEPGEGTRGLPGGISFRMTLNSRVQANPCLMRSFRGF